MLKQTQRQSTNHQFVRTKVNHNNTSYQKERPSSNIRVLRTNLVYAIGLWPQICSQSVLSGQNYFGKYGKVVKVALNKKPNVDKKGLRSPTFSAVITYQDEISASIAVISLFEFKSQNGIIRCCYGCSKYCQIFALGKTCNKYMCPYMHVYDKEKEINLTNGERFQQYDFQRHFNMASDLSFKSISKITELFKKTPTKGLFPDPYESMKILIDNDYLSIQQYENQWQPPYQKSSSHNQLQIYSTEQQDQQQSQKQKQDEEVSFDLQQSICNKIISKIHRRNKPKSNLEFVEKRPTSPRFIQKFRLLFTQPVLASSN